MLPQTSDHLKKRCDTHTSCRRDSVFRHCQVVTTRYCSVPSSAGTPAPLIEPQSANIRLDRRNGGLDLDVNYVITVPDRHRRTDGRTDDMQSYNRALRKIAR